LQLLCTNDNKAKGKREEDYRKGRILTPEFVTEHANSSYESDEMENEDYSYETGEIINRKSSGELNLIREGGKRSNAGRKPLAVTVLKRRMIENKVDEAEASFGFLVAVRDNELEPTNLRLAAAETILDRVLGKATEHSQQERRLIIEIIRENPEQQSIGPITRLALGAGTD
jgi:hypothetical protein